MDTKRLRLVESLFWEALGLDENQMDMLLSDRCGEDYSLKQMVVALVDRDRELENSQFLESVSRPETSCDRESITS